MSPRNRLIVILAWLIRCLDKQSPTGTLTYRDGHLFTSDDFSEELRCTWVLTFGRPVDIRDVTRSLVESGLPLSMFQHIRDVD